MDEVRALEKEFERREKAKKADIDAQYALFLERELQAKEALANRPTFFESLKSIFGKSKDTKRED